jgi:hypothetical protein
MNTFTPKFARTTIGIAVTCAFATFSASNLAQELVTDEEEKLVEKIMITGSRVAQDYTLQTASPVLSIVAASSL